MAAKRSPTARKGNWGDREEVILDTAWDLLTRHGYDDITMASIAEAVGLSEGSLYNYVRSKRDLAIRVAERWFQSNIDRIALELQSHRQLRDKIAYLARHHLLTILEHKSLYVMWIREVRATADYSTSSSRDIFRAYTGLLRTLLAEGMAQGVLRQDLSPSQARDMILGGVEHIAWTQIIQNRADFDPIAVSQTLMEGYWRALAVSTPPLTDSEGTDFEGDVLERLARIESKLS